LLVHCPEFIEKWRQWHIHDGKARRSCCCDPANQRANAGGTVLGFLHGQANQVERLRINLIRRKSSGCHGALRGADFYCKGMIFRGDSKQ
jgi:hypothetical protein